MDRKFKATVTTKPIPEIILSTAEYINFITENSDMEWNTVCEFIYTHGYLTHEEDSCDYIDPLDKPKQKRVDDHGCDYEFEFAKAHPWTKDILTRFIFDD